MADIKRIKHELEIRDLVARFADAVNRKATADMHQLFTHNGVLEIPGLGVNVVGVPAIIQFLDDILAFWSGIVQAVHSGRVVLQSGPHAGQAKGRWYLSEFGLREGVDTYAAGIYSDSYAKVGGGFRFTKRRFDLLYLRSGTTVTVNPFPADLPADLG